MKDVIYHRSHPLLVSPGKKLAVSLQCLITRIHFQGQEWITLLKGPV